MLLKKAALVTRPLGGKKLSVQDRRGGLRSTSPLMLPTLAWSVLEESGAVVPIGFFATGHLANRVFSFCLV